jgi:DNA-directed RNA polymerase subunit RPC12/RpoP
MFNELLQIGGLSVQNIIFIALILVLVFLLFSDVLKKSGSLKFTRPTIKSELTCTQCGFKFIRDFKEDDYISKEESTKCQKCGGTMIITRIYMIETKKTK